LAIFLMGFDQASSAGQNRRDSSVRLNLGYALIDPLKSRIFTSQYLEEHKAQPGAAGTRIGGQKDILRFEPKMPGPHPWNANFASCCLSVNQSIGMHHSSIFLGVNFVISASNDLHVYLFCCPHRFGVALKTGVTSGTSKCPRMADSIVGCYAVQASARTLLIG